MLIQAKVAKTNWTSSKKAPKTKKKRVSEWDFTVLCELSGAEEAGDPERLFGAFQGLIVGRQVGLGEGQLQVARAVGQAGVLLALGKETLSVRRGEGRKSLPREAVISGLSCEAIMDS